MEELIKLLALPTAALLIIAVFVTLWLRKAKNSLTNGPIKIDQVKFIGRGERLVLFEYDNEKYLVGVTSHSITLLNREVLGKKSYSNTSQLEES